MSLDGAKGKKPMDLKAVAANLAYRTKVYMMRARDPVQDSDNGMDCKYIDNSDEMSDDQPKKQSAKSPPVKKKQAGPAEKKQAMPSDKEGQGLLKRKATEDAARLHARTVGPPAPPPTAMEGGWFNDGW